MITANQIRGGGTYLTNHLTANDYWEEGKSVEGIWLGKAADMLGIGGKTVTPESFSALGDNLHPETGEKLTSRMRSDRVSFHDIQLSAPKDVSVLGVLGDERVREAFHAATLDAHRRLERYAAARVRRGEMVNTEAIRTTGNVASALFHHDSSRALEPQLHAHMVTANLTHDEKADCWRALQPAEMMRASLYVRQTFFEDLAQRIEALGYRTIDHSRDGFTIEGMEDLAERFSSRRTAIDEAIAKFEADKTRKATAKEVAVITRETRPERLSQTTTETVRAAQRHSLGENGQTQLAGVLDDARARGHTNRPRMAADDALAAGVEHEMHTKTSVQDWKILASTMELRQGRRIDVRALEASFDSAEKEGSLVRLPTDQITTDQVVREHAAIRAIVAVGADKSPPLADAEKVAINEKLSPPQLEAARRLAESKDRVTVLEGDAGTGKTFLLRQLHEASPAPWLALGATTGARDALKAEGFADTLTVKGLLTSSVHQAEVAGKTLIVDEGGLLGTADTLALLRLAEREDARVLFVGDTKQHAAVPRGSGLDTVKDAGAPTVRLSEVRRQLDPQHRELAKVIADGVESGNVRDGLDMALDLNLIRVEPVERDLYRNAAKSYADALAEGRNTATICPTWDGIDKFTTAARDELATRGLLDRSCETTVAVLAPCSWSEPEKRDLSRYQTGHTFSVHRSIGGLRSGELASFVQAKKDSILVSHHGSIHSLPIRQLGRVSVHEPREIVLAPGDRVQLLANDRASGLSNGTVAKVTEISGGKVQLDGGLYLDTARFRSFTYGHATTSHKAQGSTRDSVIVVLDKAALTSPAVNPRQLYVDATRHRQDLTIHADNTIDLAARLVDGPLFRREASARTLRQLSESKAESPPLVFRDRTKVVSRSAAAQGD
jgi:conjugative relaxase-like TrwC/TraI family protein